MRTTPAPVLGSFTPRFPVTSVLVRLRSGCTAGSHVRKRLLYAIVRLVSSAQNALHNGW